MIPTFRPSYSTTTDFLSLFAILGSLEASILEAMIGNVTLFKKGTSPSIPSSNSWFPKAYEMFSIIYTFIRKNLRSVAR